MPARVLQQSHYLVTQGFSSLGGQASKRYFKGDLRTRRHQSCKQDDGSSITHSPSMEKEQILLGNTGSKPGGGVPSNSSTQETKSGGSGVQRYLLLHSNFEASLGRTTLSQTVNKRLSKEKPCPSWRRWHRGSRALPLPPLLFWFSLVSAGAVLWGESNFTLKS